MKSAEGLPPKSATGRADLLRALALAPRESLTLDADGASWFGYVKRPTVSFQQAGSDDFRSIGTVKVRTTEPEHTLPLRMPFVHVIAERLPRQPPAHDETTPVAERHAEPLDEDSAKAPSAQRLVDYADLVPAARLLPALRRQLGATRTGSIDLSRLVYCLATREMPRHLPQRRWQRWHPDLVVVLDFCPRLWPYREDMHRLAERLLHTCGRSGVSLRIVNQGPCRPWSDWLAHQKPCPPEQPPERSWTMPPAGTPVLIVSDLGLLVGAQSGPGGAWQAFIAQLRKAQLQPVVLAPLGAGQLDKALPPSLPVLRWSPDARARPERPRGSGQPTPEGLDDLLAMAAVMRRVDPPLLRALRRINPQKPLNAGLEGALWCHADVEAGFSACVRSEAQEKHQRHFAERLTDLQIRVEELRYTHHAHLRAALNHEESLLWRAHAQADDNVLSPEARQRMREAERFIAKLTATLKPTDSPPSANVWWTVAQGLVQRVHADMAFGERYGRLLMPLVAALTRRGSIPPAWTDPAQLHDLLDDGKGPTSGWLVRDVAQGYVLLQAEPAGACQSPMGEPFVLDAGGARWRTGEGANTRWCWLSTRDLPVKLTSLHEPGPVYLETAQEAITVATVQRPRGVLEWGCHGGDLRVRTPPLGGLDMRWAVGGRAGLRVTPLPDKPAWSLEADAVTVELASTPIQFGLDRQFGVYANFTVSTSHGAVTQRLRWMEPGRFLMGSPDDEAEREHHEGPRHWVTLRRGFWLADTACTQALWQAVMGGNPSLFTEDAQHPVEGVSWHAVQEFRRELEALSSGFTGDAQRPVVGVSWHAVQKFLRKLEALLPGCRADLPTEAEWEYACRAGTTTPFSFGAQITPEQVNYNGNFPYTGGKKGVYREQTVPVKCLPPNAWGLYEMHGNVEEWCADGLRPYTDEPQQDPIGPQDEAAFRALCGGSWDGDAGGARSACRFAYPTGDALRDLGFRLCLRSIESGQEPGRPGGPAEGATGGSEGIATLPPGEAGWLARLKRTFRPAGKKK